jgi:hypothetical protein
VDRAKVAVSTGRIDYKAVHSDQALERLRYKVSVAEKRWAFAEPNSTTTASAFCKTGESSDLSRVFLFQFPFVAVPHERF